MARIGYARVLTAEQDTALQTVKHLNCCKLQMTEYLGASSPERTAEREGYRNGGRFRPGTPRWAL